MRVAVAGGKTGGHIYPAIAVLEALEEESESLSVLWLGTLSGPEGALVSQRGWQFVSLGAVGVRGSGLAMPWNVLKNLLESFRARAFLKRFGASAVLATGGFLSVPAVLGAKMAAIPVLLFVPDVQPGWAARLLAPLSTRVAASTAVAARKLGAHPRVFVSGYPVRAAFWQMDKARARNQLGLDDRPVVLVAGGSSGARRLNLAMLRWAPELVSAAQIVHVAGRRDYAWVQDAARQLGLGPRRGYHLFEYLEQLALGMAAADLVVTRAGASTLGELPAAGRAAVLVPGPFSDQRENARYLADQGCAVILPDEEVEEQLGPVVRELLHSPERLQAMAERARALATPQAAQTIARALIAICREDKLAH
jgi:UDP-N-acetylglucosamine--N-acetylmuramyl-(pentapeptide) pyrophosphoryl-undecaprenol N-acetylglucosamine transferase